MSPPIVIRRSTRARRLGLRLDPKERHFQLTVPGSMPLEKAYLFADNHKDWMKREYARLPAPVYFEDGSTLPIFGTNRHIDITFAQDYKRTAITLCDNYLKVKTNKANPGNRIERFLKEKAKARFSEIAHLKATEIRRGISDLRTGDTKTRWGSCGANGRISLSWRLIFAPYAAMDYVIAHEVAHLKHLNHGPKFWALCEALSENYRTGKDWMKRHSSKLMAYGPAPDNPVHFEELTVRPADQ